MTDMSRRLPVYLLLDCSESMAGDAIEDVSRGLHEMLSALRSDPLAIETAYLSVITFSRYAKQLAPLTEVLDFQVPKLSVRTGTAMGAALKLLLQCIKTDVRKTTSGTKGDYKPLVFLFTDGQPTDKWEDIAHQLRAKRKPGIANIYAIGCGADVDTDILRQITDIVLTMKDTSSEAWRKVFVWLTASVQQTSRALDSGGEGQAVDLPSLPDELGIAPEHSGPKDHRPRQVFLHARCGKKGDLYLMRFARRGEEDRYVALCSHPLEEEEEDGGESLPPINTSLLDGCPPCPYCDSPVAIMCDCGTLMCWSGSPRDILTCPTCHAQGMPGEGQTGFDIDRVQG